MRLGSLSDGRSLGVVAAALLLPLAATAVLAASYLKGAREHRGAVLAATHQVAGVMLRDGYDLTYSRVVRAARDIELAGHPHLPDAAAAVLAMGAVADSLGSCACDRALPTLAAFVWRRAVGDLALSPGARLTGPELGARLAQLDVDRVEANPTRMFVAVSPAGEAPWFLMMHSVGGTGAIAGVAIDLERLAVVFEPIRRSLGTTYGGGVPWFGDSVRLRVSHIGGAALYTGGTITSEVTRAALPLFGDEQMLQSATPGRSLLGELALGRAAVSVLVPGGMPVSPAPLVAAVIAAAVLLSALALLLFRRVRQVLLIREQFVSGVSHDLRTPLTKILVYAETLELDRQTPDLKREAGEIIAREARRLIHLTENALAFVRGQRPSAGFTPVELDVAAATRDLLREHERVRVDGPQRIVAIVDAAGYRQIVSNLIDNAERYASPGPILVGLDQANGHLLLSVMDQGPAIDPADRDRIFDPFIRLQPGSANGAGLGLAIVRQTVRLHGGSVSLSTSTSGGNLFMVRLPLTGPGPGNGAGQ